MGRIRNSYTNYYSDNNQESANGSFKYPTFFKEGVNSIRLRKPKTSDAPMQVRILPSFDYEASNTESFKCSVLPFMKPDGMYTDWVNFIRGYTWFGELHTELISPDTVNVRNFEKFPFPRAGVDPIADLRSFIFFGMREKKTLLDGVTPLITDEDYSLIQKPVNKKDNVKLPAKPRVFAISNVIHLNPNTGEYENAVMSYSEQAFNMFISILKTPALRSMTKVVNANFPDLMYGDPTDVDTGYFLYGRDVVNTLMKNKILTLHPLQNDTLTVDSLNIFKLDKNYLENRYDLSDDEHVLDIWSYDRILDLLCKDPMVPIELLKKAEDNGVFKNHGSLNYDLRAEGEEIVAKRMEKNGAQEPVQKTYVPSSNLPKFNYNDDLDEESVGNTNDVYTPKPDVPTPTVVNISNNTETDNALEKAKQKLSPEDFEFFKSTEENMKKGKIIDFEEMKRYYEIKMSL